MFTVIKKTETMRKISLKIGKLLMLPLLVLQLVSCEKEPAVVNEIDLNLYSLMIDGVMVTDFNSATTSYEVSLPYGLEKMPVITAEAADENAEVTIVQVSELPGLASVTVSGNDDESKVYSVSFLEDAPLLDNVNLKSLKVSGEMLDGFDPAIVMYEALWPFEQDELPVVTAEAADDNATIDIVQISGLPGIAKVTVSGNGFEPKVYFINFTEADPLSVNANLKSLKVDGEMIDGFSALITEFDIKLGADAEIPVVSAESEDENATVEITQITDFPGQAIIKVTAENGETVKQYTIDFTKAQIKMEFLVGKWNLIDGVTYEEKKSKVWYWQLTFDENGFVLWEGEYSSFTYMWEVYDEEAHIIRLHEGSTEIFGTIEQLDEKRLIFTEVYDEQNWRYTFERVEE